MAVEKTGKSYHMVSEAQREYAARGGSKGSFPFPMDEGKPYSIAKHANTYGPEDGFSYTAPAGATAPTISASTTPMATSTNGLPIARPATTTARPPMAAHGWPVIALEDDSRQ